MMLSKPSDKPKQYKLGFVEFYKLKFKVTPDVLIPRPETELLVDEVLSFTRTNLARLTILDLGTGAGNIAISLAKNLNQQTRSVGSKIIAIDISSKALKVAKQNAKLHSVTDKIHFIQSNLLQHFCHPEHIEGSPNLFRTHIRGRFFGLRPQNDNLIIVTNLPYIPSERIPYLDPSVKDFEPHIALDGGKDGFDLYRKLFAQIFQLKWKPQLIIGEIDYTQGELAIQEALKYFPDSEVEIKFDLAHKQRILKITD